MSAPSPAAGFSLQGESWPCLPDSIPSSTGCQAHHELKKGYCPNPEALSPGLRVLKMDSLPDRVEGGRLSHNGALKPIGSLPCELELEQGLSLPLPRPTMARTNPTHVVSSSSPKPLILLGFISRIGVNFLIYCPLCLSFPFFIFILLCLEEAPATKNHPPEAKTKPDTPSASPLLPGENSVKKYFVYTEKTELSREMGIFYAPKQLLKQKAARLLMFHAALFILKEELNSCK